MNNQKNSSIFIFPTSLRTFIYPLLITLAGSLLLSLSAQIAFPLPFTPIPVTMQTVAIAILAMTLPPKLALFSVVIYLTEACLGFPILAQGISNPIWFLGARAGYLFGFCIAAYITSFLINKKIFLSTFSIWALLFLNEIMILSCGTLWLFAITPSSIAFSIGFVPFLPAALYKSVLALFLYQAIKK